jgi:mRNA interferase MazF
MPNTTPYEFGDVVLVPFPFADSSGVKKRAAAVVSSNAYNAEAIVISQNEHLDLIIVLAITSVGGALGTVDIKKWSQAGLLHPSAFKPAITTLAETKVIRKLGKLSPEDKNRLKHVLVKVLNLVPSSIAPAPQS